MRISVFQPKNPVLAELIQCIYTLTRTAEEAPAKYLTFPSIFTIISISEHSVSTLGANTLHINYSVSRSIETNLVGNFNKPVFVTYEGARNEITIYFKPLGLNAFLPNDLVSYGEGIFPEFAPFTDYRQRMSAILTLPDEEDRIHALEEYWLSKFRGFAHPHLEHAVKTLTHDPSVSVTALANSVSTSRATLNHHFRKHLGKTPTQFRKIVRFRAALEQQMLQNPDHRLTDITHALDYFDQSHMIKDFRALTGLSPRKFFSEITEFEAGQIVWLFR